MHSGILIIIVGGLKNELAAMQDRHWHVVISWGSCMRRRGGSGMRWWTTGSHRWATDVLREGFGRLGVIDKHPNKVKLQIGVGVSVGHGRGKG